MIVPERPMMFYKSRPFLGEQLGASRTTEVCENGFMIGFEWYNVAATQAATLKSLSNLFLELMSFSFPLETFKKQVVQVFVPQKTNKRI